MQKIALSLAACLMALAATGAHAQNLWKWRDASGQLHISDTPPPPGTPARNIVGSPAGGAVLKPLVATAPVATLAAEPTGAASTAAESALDRKKKAADKDKADKEKADRAEIDAKNAAIRKDNCARARASLTDLQGGQRIARINDKGEREVLDDAARAQEIKHTQDVVTSSCAAAPAP